MCACRVHTPALLTTALAIVAACALPRPGFAQSLDLKSGWQALGETGNLSATATGEQAAPLALTLSATRGSFAAVGPALPIKAWRGRGLKLRAMVKLEQAVGKTYLAVELLRRRESLGLLAESNALTSDTPGWVARWLVTDVPADTPATHLRVRLHSDDNSGQAHFRQVSLTRLPPNQPVIDGPVRPPQRGQIIARDGHLVDSQGQRIRLWGINCVDELGRDYRQITQIVARIKQMGFNAVRLHLYDSRFIDTEARTAAGEPTSRVWREPGQRGDGSLPDRMDYFIYRAEKAGLYLYLTFDRGGAAFGPGDYDVLPSAGPEDEAAWKEAVAATNQGWANEHLYFVDDRLQALQLEYARRQLQHVNAYTGTRIGDDPYVALWELTNENGFPSAMVSGSYRQWPEYFQRKFQQRWNTWLRERYASQTQLLASWGSMQPGESLSDGSIRPAPHIGEAADYPAARHADFRRFIYDLTIGFNRKLEAVLATEGKCSPRAPVSHDTVFEHKHAWFYPVSQGTFQAIGQYVAGTPELARNRSFLGRRPLDAYAYSAATIADKPMVVYESNIHLPAADRAYYPIWIASFASFRDWDGVFWYAWSDGTVYDQVDAQSYPDNGLRYAAPGHIWHGIVTSTDEVKLSSLGLAGELFTRFIIPPAPDPVVVTVGADALLGPSLWTGDVPLPYPPDAPEPYRRWYALAATDMLYTTRYRYSLEEPRSSVSRPLIARTPDVYSPAPGLNYDFRRGVITVNQPQAQAVVGYTGGQWRFGPDSRVSARECPFFCYGLVSQDGRPLAQTERAHLYFATYGENRGMTLRADPNEVTANVPGFAKLVSSWGYGPPDLARPPLDFRWPQAFRVSPVDFLLRPLSGPRQPVREWSLPAGQQLFRAELTTD
ncbi:MAG: hypothetical protein HPY69_07515 [Armatimonadetes bacterium]|nr:hypothetical protein [Armatimonadota bacterium]